MIMEVEFASSATYSWTPLEPQSIMATIVVVDSTMICRMICLALSLF